MLFTPACLAPERDQVAGTHTDIEGRPGEGFSGTAHGDAGMRSTRSRRGIGGTTLLEVVIATAILLLTSLSLAYAFTSTEITTRSADRATNFRASLQAVAESVADVDYADLLSWNGVTVDRGDHSVVVATALVQVGLISVEVRVVDDDTGTVVGRLASLRASGI
jgi:hypothetical protein